MNKYEMIEAILLDTDSWTEDELRTFVRETLLEQWHRAPHAAIVREYQALQRKRSAQGGPQ